MSFNSPRLTCPDFPWNTPHFRVPRLQPRNALPRSLPRYEAPSSPSLRSSSLVSHCPRGSSLAIPALATSSAPSIRSLKSPPNVPLPHTTPAHHSRTARADLFARKSHGTEARLTIVGGSILTEFRKTGRVQTTRLGNMSQICDRRLNINAGSDGFRFTCHGRMVKHAHSSMGVRILYLLLPRLSGLGRKCSRFESWPGGQHLQLLLCLGYVLRLAGL